MAALLLTLLAIATQPGQELVGVVQDETGKPIDGATVVLVHPSDAEQDIVATSDADGRFRIAATVAESDSVQLLAWKPSFAAGPARSERRQDRFQLTVGEESMRDTVIVLLPAETSVVQIQTPDGAPLRGVTVTPIYLARDRQSAYRDAGLPALFAGKTDDAGRVSLPGVGGGVSGSFYVRTTAYGPQYFSIPHDGRSPRTVVLARVGRLGGRLFAERLDRLDGWEITVSPAPSAARKTGETTETATGRGKAVTNANGSFEIPHLAAGDYQVSVRHPDVEAFTMDGPTTVTIAAGDKAEVAVHLKPAVRAFGRVTERESGKAIAGVTLQFGGTTATTDENGAFEGFVSDSPNYVSITTAPEGYVNPPFSGRGVQLSDGSAGELDLGTITLKRTQVISGAIHDEAGEAVSGITVTAAWVQHAENGGQASNFASETALSDVAGNYRLVRTPDNLAVLISAFGKGLAVKAPVTVSAGDAREVNLTVGDQFTTVLLARVTDTNGKPLPTAVAKLKMNLETASGKTFGGRHVRIAGQDIMSADDTGTVRTPLPVERSRKYSLEISADGFLPHTTPFIRPTESDSESLLGEFALQRARSAAGIILDTSGKPVAGVSVSAHGIPTQRYGQQPLVRVESDESGHFRLSPLHPATAVVTVRADGYRPTGAVISDTGEVRVTIYRRDEAVAALDRITVPDRDETRRAAGIKLLDDILPHVRKSNYFYSKALKLLNDAAPNKVAEELTQATRSTNIAEALTLIGEFEEANAQVEQIESGYSRGYARFGIIDACPNETFKQQLLAEALIDAKTIQEPDRRAVVLAGVAQRLTALGQHDQARALLTESLAQFQQLPDKEWAGFAKGFFAERLARYDFAGAVAMLEGMEARDKARHAGNMAHFLAALEPEKAEQLMTTSDASFRVIAYRIRTCYRMAPVDLERAERIRQGEPRNSSFAKEHTLGVMAMAIREQQPDKARELLRQGWSELEASLQQRGGNTSAGTHRFGVALALLSYAESIDPENLTDYFWRAIALYPGPQGHSRQPDQQQVEDLQRQAQLVLAFGLYDSEPELCCRITGPAFAYWSNPKHLQGQEFYRKTATFSAMALADPQRAAQWALDARNIMPEKNRTLIPQPWLTVLQTLCPDRQSVQDTLGGEVFIRWTIDKHD